MVQLMTKFIKLDIYFFIYTNMDQRWANVGSAAPYTLGQQR